MHSDVKQNNNLNSCVILKKSNSHCSKQILYTKMYIPDSTSENKFITCLFKNKSVLLKRIIKALQVPLQFINRHIFMFFGKLGKKSITVLN